MPFHVPNKVQRLWDEWNLRGAILLSLFLQVLMTLSAPSRKRIKNKMLTSVIWSAYLLADWVAAFAIGLITSVEGDNRDKPVVNKDLAAFWAPFLLLHLGGPDTITAFSPEDNELWLRHLAGLLFQLGAVVYVFSQSTNSEFQIPTILLIFAGTIKYVERTRALFLARSGNYGDFGDDVPEIRKKAESMSEIEVVKGGKIWFKHFSLLILHSTSSEINPASAKGFFSYLCTSKDAYRILEVELNFMYDTLYTKMAVVHNKIGYIFRFICYLLTVISFQQFASHHNKQKFNIIDIAITYTLLIVAVGLDLVSLLMLIFSDWTLVSVKNTVAKSILCAIRKRLPIFNKRWRQSVSQFNLISYSLGKRSSKLDKVTDFLGLKDILDEMQYTKTNPVKDGLKDFIFEQLKSMKALTTFTEAKNSDDFSIEEYDSLKEIFLARGNWILSQHLNHDPTIIQWSVSKQVDYYESLLMWHVATELCYITDPSVPESYDEESKLLTDSYRENSKMISDYMLYLLVMRPGTLVESATAIVVQRMFRTTCKHVKLLMKLELNTKKFYTIEEKHKFVCDYILKNFLYGSVRSERGRLRKESVFERLRKESVLEDARDLACNLLKIKEDEDRWEIMSKVWVELLRFGAMNSTARSHAQLLSKGGELITLVSLLNAHFGLGYQFMQCKPSDRRKPSLHNMV